MQMTTLGEERKRFNTEAAPLLAAQAGGAAAPVVLDGASTRFAYFASDDELVIVSGEHEAKDSELALAYGLTLREGRRLVLVLPRRFALPTLQRAACLRASAMPQVWVHDTRWGGSPTTPSERVVPTWEDALGRLKDRLGALTPDEELARAFTPYHPGVVSRTVGDLVEWATHHPVLDPAHRKGERSWQCAGQRVLSIAPSAAQGLTIRGGIHFTGPHAPVAHGLGADGELSTEALDAIVADVEGGIAARLNTEEFRKPDEHWLQAVIRRRPELVGVEQPALREVPAWRPVGGERKWGRGYIDLIGLDGHGDIRIVETKLAKNKDDLLIFQGLDYYLWGTVYRDALRARLGASPKAQIVLHYVLGAFPASQQTILSGYAAAQIAAIREDIPWRFQVVTGWYQDPADWSAGAQSTLLPDGQFPDGEGGEPSS